MSWQVEVMTVDEPVVYLDQLTSASTMPRACAGPARDMAPALSGPRRQIQPAQLHRGSRGRDSLRGCAVFFRGVGWGVGRVLGMLGEGGSSRQMEDVEEAQQQVAGGALGSGQRCGQGWSCATEPSCVIRERETGTRPRQWTKACL